MTFRQRPNDLWPAHWYLNSSINTRPPMMRKRCSRQLNKSLFLAAESSSMTWADLFQKETHFRTKISQICFASHVLRRRHNHSRNLFEKDGATESRVSHFCCRRIAVPDYRLCYCPLVDFDCFYGNLTPHSIMTPWKEGQRRTRKVVILMKPFQLRLYFDARIVLIGQTNEKHGEPA